MPQQHLTRPRGFELAPRSIFLDGRFGRMFRNLPAFNAGEEALDDLASSMRDPGPAAPGPSTSWQPSQDENDSAIPAGYTYLGQFIDHDITFDPASSLQRQNDPDALENFRTPRFDLDSLYGRGQNNDVFMYDPAIDGGRTSLLLGRAPDGKPDLPRNVLPASSPDRPRGRALIGDPRNDENIIVSQLHLLFLRFHNAVVAKVQSEEPPSLRPDELFEEAQRIVRWHYQWIVVHDFLRRVVGDDVVEDILQDRPIGRSEQPTRREILLKFFHWQRRPFMPVEFSVAAYRFGHSMIRATYKINDTVPELPLFVADADPGQFDSLHGFRPLPEGWTVDWQFFFETGDGSRLQLARKIDAKLSASTFTLPGDAPTELAVRNLHRGLRMSLPSGQRVARFMGFEPLTDEELGIASVAPDFVGAAPLWFYILKEAELNGGNSLGPVGAHIVAEVLLGLLKGDPLSFVNVEPNWVPDLADDGSFTISDLVSFVGPPT